MPKSEFKKPTSKENVAAKATKPQTAPTITFKSYALRTCAADMTSHGGFQWPTEGRVEAPDWDPRPQCGNGLHGLLMGKGDGSLCDWSSDAKWLVVGIDEWVDLDGKVKFPAATVLYVGDLHGAAQMLQGLGAGTDIVGGTATAGDGGTATAGYRGTATAGYRGTATAGYRGTATAGDGGTATAGVGGTATAGYDGSIAIQYWDSNKNKYRVRIAEVGEDGIEANVAYQLSGDKFVRVKKEGPDA